MAFRNEQKPPINEVVEHYGVKGMKWGIVDGEETSGAKSSSAKEKADKNALTKEYMAVKPKQRTEKEARANLVRNQRKFLAKADPSVSPEEARQKKV